MVKLNNEHFYGERNVLKSDKIKTQIVLINTGSNINDHLTKLKFRHNKKYDRIPAFTVDRSGTVYQHLDTDCCSNILSNDGFNKQAIVISLENVGWLEYDGHLDLYNDWKGRSYSKPIAEVAWRGKKFWATYTDEQFLALVELLNYLCYEHSINRNFIGTNTISGKLQSYNGILTRSNFSKNHYDLNPTFEYDKLTEIINV